MMKYKFNNEALIKDKYGIDIIDDVLINLDGRIILLMDAIDKEDVKLHLISGKLSKIGLCCDKTTFGFDQFYDLIDFNNKYAEISSKAEYKRYLDLQLKKYQGSSDVTFPIISNGVRTWIKFVTYPIKHKEGLFGCFLYDLTELMTLEELKHEKTHKDALTGLFNQYTFDYHYGLRYQFDDFHVMYLDLDDFKEINDRHGHQVGNDFLIAFSSVLKNYESEYNKFYRIGGDEFIGLVFLKTNEVKQLAKEIIDQTSNIKFPGIRSKISVSIGISKYIDEADPVRKADELLYQVKSRGKNDYLFG